MMEFLPAAPYSILVNELVSPRVKTGLLPTPSKTLLAVWAFILEMCPNQLTTKVSAHLSDTQTIHLNYNLPQ